MILVLHIVVADYGWHSASSRRGASGPQVHCAERYCSFRTQARLFRGHITLGLQAARKRMPLPVQPFRAEQSEKLNSLRTAARAPPASRRLEPGTAPPDAT